MNPATDPLVFDIYYLKSRMILQPDRGRISIRDDQLKLEILENKDDTAAKVLFDAPITDITYNRSRSTFVLTHDGQDYMLRCNKEKALLQQLKLKGVKLGGSVQIGKISKALLAVFTLVLVGFVVFALLAAAKSQ